jgi:hypothetical protein
MMAGDGGALVLVVALEFDGHRFGADDEVALVDVEPARADADEVPSAPDAGAVRGRDAGLLPQLEEGGLLVALARVESGAGGAPE